MTSELPAGSSPAARRRSATRPGTGYASPMTTIATRTNSRTRRVPRITTSTPDEMRKVVVEERDKWARLVRERKIEVN